MKKLMIFSPLLFLLLATIFLTPDYSLAQTPVNINLDKIGQQLPAGFTSLPNIVSKIFVTTIGAATVLFVVMLLFGGLNYLTGAGNEEATKKAKGRILDATIGLIITLSAWALGTFILSKLGYSGVAGTAPRPGATTATRAIRVTARISQNFTGAPNGPAQGATITINGNVKGITGVDGTLTFQIDQGPGEYNLVIQKTGCATIQEKPRFVSGSFSKTLFCN